MILINKKDFAVKDIAKRLGIEIPLDKLQKKPLFEINPALIKKDVLNGPGAVKFRQAMDFPTWFRTKLSNGDEVEIRYATSRQPDQKTNGNSEKFSPREVTFDGKAEYIKDDLDKAVYFYLHFFCANSPFNNGRPHEYELVDDNKRADKIIKNLTLKGRAVAHASALQGDKLILTAKGMRMNIPADGEIEMVKAQLMQYAMEKPEEYLVKAESQVNHIHGLIIDAIDKGIFTLQHQHNTKKWYWGEGVKKGIEICSFPATVNDEREVLINHISEHMNDFIPTLISTVKERNSAKKLEAQVGELNVFDELGIDDEENDGQEDEDADVSDNAQYLPIPEKTTPWPNLMSYIKGHLGKARTDITAEFKKGLESGEINEENIGLHMASWRVRSGVQ